MMVSSVARWCALVFCGISLIGLHPGCYGPLSKAPAMPEVASLENAIINGQGDLSEPAIGAITSQGRSFCTGTLITTQLVVTAAHCIDAVNRYGGPTAVRFRTDFTDPNQPFRSVSHEVIQVDKHPQYTSGSGADYDIAVMVLKKKAQNITPISPNLSPMDQKWVGTNVRVVGYGLIQTQPSNRSADKKYAADIPLFRISNNSFIHFDGQTPVNQRKSACHGDSGGPALYTVGGLKRVLGVTSIAYQATSVGSGQTLCDGGAVSTRLDTHANYLRPFLLRYSDGPQACQEDKECGACGLCGTGKTCEPKPINKEADHCKPCKADADCGNGICYRFKTGFRCLQACTSDNCCPSGSFCNSLSGISTSKSVCQPETDSCPAAACTADADCGLGEVCDPQAKECVVKLPPRSPELCKPCTDNKDCGSGLCLGLAGNGRCSQECGAGDFCPTGYVCRQPYAGLAKQCIPEDGTCKIPCEKDEQCPADFACTNKLCARKGGGTYGDPCDPMPCAQGLTCANTTNGKACMQVCGIKPGYGGKECLANDKCEGGTRCFRNSSIQVCLGQCTSSADCRAAGGGACSSVGNCLCQRQGDCETGYVCNFFTYDQRGYIGSCVPTSANRPCPTGYTCSGLTDGEYCVKDAPGNRSIGESCDSAHKCKDGLTCFYTSSGYACFEDCSNAQGCKLGGQCVQVGRSTRLCMCRGNECPTGRTCEIAIQGYGVCSKSTQGPAQGCVDDKDCPIDYACREAKCVYAPKPAEPASEPTPEPVSDAGAGPEPKPEPQPEPKVTPEPGPEPAPKPDTAPTADTGTTPELNPPSGCGCELSSTGSPQPGAPFSFALLFLLSLLWIKRRR